MPFFPMFGKNRSKGWETSYTLGAGNRLASSQTTVLTNRLFVSGSANELIGTDDRWGMLLITNLTAGTSVVPSVNGSTFAAEVSGIGNASNTLVAAMGKRGQVWILDIDMMGRF